MSMPSGIFSLWGGGQKFVRERVIVGCQAHADFLGTGRTLWRRIRDREDPHAQSVLETLYTLLLEVERTPLPFDECLLERVRGLGGGLDRISRRWGEEVGRASRDFTGAAERLCGLGSALRVAIRSRLEGSQSDDRIYCHRSEVPLLEGFSISDHSCLKTPSEYRAVGAFERLIKVGGLRRHGIGRIPDSVMAAPRFKRMLQFVWSDDSDESEFGDSAEILGFRIDSHWTTNENRINCGHVECAEGMGHAPDDGSMETWYANRPQRGDVEHPTVLRLANGRAIALRSGGHEMVYSVVDRIASTKLANEISEGDLLLRYEGEIDFGALAVLSDPLVDRWREELSSALDSDTLGFLNLLRRNGVQLRTLRHAVHAWCKNRRPKEFQTLRQVCAALSWSDKDLQRLWRKFSAHQSLAIADGVLGNELEREAIVDAINSRVTKPGEQLPQEFEIHVGDSRLVVTSFLVDEPQSWDSIADEKLHKILEWEELRS